MAVATSADECYLSLRSAEMTFTMSGWWGPFFERFRT
jgi:hypothetical protein